jgi:CHAD domain-containing protein
MEEISGIENFAEEIPEEVDESVPAARPPAAPPIDDVASEVSSEASSKLAVTSIAVHDLALTLFDRTRPLHNLNEDGRNLLELAASLYLLPIPRRRKKPLQAALGMVQAQVQQELNPEEQCALAAVLAYHHHKLKQKDIECLEISPLRQRQALTIAALLEIAIGLDHSGSGQTVIEKVEPTPEGMWIVVSGPQATADAAEAQENAHLWEKIGYPAVEVLEPDEAAIRQLPFPEPMGQIGLLASDSLAEAGRKVMRYHFAEMLRHEDGVRLGEDIEALHDMRVATRRLRAAFEVFKEAFKPAALKPHLTGLRMAGRTLGSVRDLDVLLEKLGRYLKTLPEERRPGLQPLLNAWQDERQRARATLLTHMDSREYAVFKRKFNVFLNTPGAGARSIPADQPTPFIVRDLAPVLIYRRLASVRAFGPYLQGASLEQLHALRIEFKKLRYSVEYFSEALGKRSKDVIDSLKKMQDHLGDLNDANVATRLLRDFIDNWEISQAMLPINERQNIEEVVNYMAYRHAERHQLMLSFQQTWRQYFMHSRFRRGLASAISVL